MTQYDFWWWGNSVEETWSLKKRPRITIMVEFRLKNSARNIWMDSKNLPKIVSPITKLTSQLNNEAANWLLYFWHYQNQWIKYLILRQMRGWGAQTSTNEGQTRVSVNQHNQSGTNKQEQMRKDIKWREKTCKWEQAGTSECKWKWAGGANVNKG